MGEQLPTLTLGPADLPVGGIPIVQLLVRSGLVGSGKDARRLIAEGGARLDDAPLIDAGLHLDAAALAGGIKLSAGRTRHALVRMDG
jgi:tyrosyl-tRNA synthetase